MKNQVIEGVTVADFSMNVAGPLCSRELAEHGATVVRIEYHKRPDSTRTAPPFKDFFSHPDYAAMFAAFNTNKYGISLDLNKDRGQEIAKKLVCWADVVLESMLPGVMVKWGLDYEGCKKINPGIIYASTCQHGQYGPYAKAPGYGIFSAGMAGFAEVTGWPDRAPSYMANAYTDFISPWYLAVAVILALLRRRKTGKGMYIEQAQIEAGLTLLGPMLLDYSVNRRVPDRMGNHDPYMTPHNAYRCRGNDSWVAIAVSTEEEWQALCRVIDRSWTNDPRFSTFLSRKENETELDRLIQEWVINFEPEEAVGMMQKAGVLAGIVAKGEDLFADTQLQHRNHFQYLEHKFIGRYPLHAPAYKLSETPSSLWKAAPCLGQDNDYVYKKILGLSDDEISDLMAEGVITTEGDLPGTP